MQHPDHEIYATVVKIISGADSRTASLPRSSPKSWNDLVRVPAAQPAC
jgi:hypothetical protein